MVLPSSHAAERIKKKHRRSVDEVEASSAIRVAIDLGYEHLMGDKVRVCVCECVCVCVCVCVCECVCVCVCCMLYI